MSFTCYRTSERKQNCPKAVQIYCCHHRHRQVLGSCANQWSTLGPTILRTDLGIIISIIIVLITFGRQILCGLIMLSGRKDYQLKISTHRWPKYILSCQLQDCNCCSFVLSVFHGQATLRQIWEHLDFITELPLSTSSSSSTTFPWCFCDPLFWRLVLDDTAVMAFVRTHLGILDCQKKLQPTTQDNGINHYGEWSIGMNLNNSTPQLSIFINIKLINMYFQV